MLPPTWRPDTVDLNRANAARVYDYILGGAHNFAVDREVARTLYGMNPAIREMVHSSRAFLRRAVQFCLAEGVRQFVDLGSGLPTAGNVHELARPTEPASRVVYVDRDATTVAHSRAMLAGVDGVGVLQADAGDVDQVLHGPVAARLLDFERPIALCAVGLLEYLPSEYPAELLAKYRALLPTGSLLVLSHLTSDFARHEEFAKVTELAGRRGWPIRWRPREEIAELFAGVSLVEPGLVPAWQWRPDAADPRTALDEVDGTLAGVGRLG